MQQEATTSDYRKLGQDMIYVNTVSLKAKQRCVMGVDASMQILIELLICGILCLVMSSLQNL